MLDSKLFYRFLAFSIILFPFIFSSCASNKKYIYFYNNKLIQSKDSSISYTPVLKPDDILGITVSSIDLDAVKPFNLPVVSYNTNGQVVGNPTLQGFLIDSKGMIEFPVIGKIKLSGLSRPQAAELLKEKIKNYVKDPIVIIRILNYKVTVIGDVRNPGSITIPNERITILEAIGQAGDLNITGNRQNVLVIREIEGKKIGTRVDLTSSEIVNSPVYYLNQNDIIYVEPNKTKVNSARLGGNVNIILTSVSLLFSSIYLIITLSKL